MDFPFILGLGIRLATQLRESARQIELKIGHNGCTNYPCLPTDKLAFSVTVNQDGHDIVRLDKVFTCCVCCTTQLIAAVVNFLDDEILAHRLPTMSTSTTKLPCLKYDCAMCYLATNYLFLFPLFSLFLTMTLVLTSQYMARIRDSHNWPLSNEGICSFVSTNLWDVCRSGLVGILMSSSGSRRPS
ncbi:hypothetical protein CI102_3919 [Trichoderma harzianum]|nr:hypothetical protein CI102_3919 [Trichoderma harzianum]